MTSENLLGPGTGAPTGSSGNSTAFHRGSVKYDTPFLDMTSTFLPRNIKGILRFVAVYVMGDGLVSQCVSKMSEYPITKLLYKDDKESSIKDDQTIEEWKKILEKKMKLVRSMKQAGMDYYSYGNSIVSINWPFKRIIKCPKCKKDHAPEGLKAKFRGFKYHAKCKTKDCNYNGKMDARDIKTKEIDKLGLVHWDLIYMDIKYNSITGDHFYFYSIPADLSASIRRGDMDIISTTRLEVIEAVKSRKQLKLMADNVFHLKRPAPQYLFPAERGWGIPVIMPVMKDIFHCKVLKKGNEMIAFDHIVPLRILFPQGTGDVSPHATINLSGWKSKIENEIRMWRADPNRISVVPLPLCMQNFSGDSKILSVTPEIKATEDSIITGIGIIPEIIRGGASWSGSNVSLRVVENTFLNHRNDMHEFLDFVVDNVSKYLGKPKISIRMTDFKMADDIEKKKMMLEATRGSTADALISRSTATKELGFDPKEEYENRKEELKELSELRIKEAESFAEAEGARAVIGAQFQADAEIENQNRMEMHDRELQGKRDEFSDIDKEENASEVDKDVDYIASKRGIEPGYIQTQNFILTLTQRFAKLAKTNVEDFKIRMLAMKNQTPYLFREIFQNMKEMNLIEADTMPDLAKAQESTPGEIPSNMQGDNSADDNPSPAEAGADPSVLQPADPSSNGMSNINGSLPEAKVPTSQSSPI